MLKPIESAPDAEVTQVTQVTRKNIETENKTQADDTETVVLLQTDSATETAPTMFAPVEPETNATAGTGEQSRHALPCSENDKALLADAVALIGW